VYTQTDFMETKKSIKSLIFSADYDNRNILPRLIVGVIFFTEGIQKYLFPELLGTGRFAKIGFTDPSFWAYFTGTFEIICGSLVLIGLFTRFAAIPLFIVMITAFVTTKWSILMNKGFWVMMHEYRTDFAMTLLLIYLFIYGSGKWSVDSKFFKSSSPSLPIGARP
jgi:putative oxidoreductase